MALFIILVTLGYLMGSICSAVIVCRLSSLPDPREAGSKNPGATNVLRLGGKRYAALVMLIDLLKGTIPVLIAKALGAEPATIAFTALAAVVGHMFPVFFGFRGGKGVATAIGALLGFNFLIGVIVAATWLLIAKFSRYSSLASIISMSLAPFYTLVILGRMDVLTPLFFMVILILYKHKDNITRLIDGVEPKIKLKPNILDDIMDHKHPPVTTAHEPVLHQKDQNPQAPTAKKPVKKEKKDTITKKVKVPKSPIKTKSEPVDSTTEALNSPEKPGKAAPLSESITDKKTDK